MTREDHAGTVMTESQEIRLMLASGAVRHAMAFAVLIIVGSAMWTAIYFALLIGAIAPGPGWAVSPVGYPIGHRVDCVGRRCGRLVQQLNRIFSWIESVIPWGQDGMLDQ
jgi:hypothetical protein